MTRHSPYRPFSTCPHTYGVRSWSCPVITTEPCRPTACAGEQSHLTDYPPPFRHTPVCSWPRPTATVWRNLRQHPRHYETYTFSAKEKDSETGLSYFGSRYYSSDLSIWLSVDPMSDKYPTLSPYSYCADNPVKVVDPNGDTVIVTGAAADSYIEGMNTVNLTFSRNESGYVSYQGTPMTSLEKHLVAAVEDRNVFVNICATNSRSIDNIGGVPDCMQTAGGSFLGTVYENGIVNTYQQVNPDIMIQSGNDIGVGRGMFEWHELTESYEAGIISLDYKYSSPRAGLVGSIYNAAHDKASFAYDLDCTTIDVKIPVFEKNGRLNLFKYNDVTLHKYSIRHEN